MGGAQPNFPIDPITKKKFSLISFCAGLGLASTKKIINNTLTLKKKKGYNFVKYLKTKRERSPEQSRWKEGTDTLMKVDKGTKEGGMTLRRAVR